MSADKILVADKDINNAEFIGENLEKFGYRIITAHDGREAIKQLRSENPALVILDFSLSGTDGKQLCRAVSEINNVPIIVISENEDITDKIIAFELGADDYLVKPFDMRELSARIKAILRRASSHLPDNDKIIICSNMKINMTNYELKIDGSSISIPPKELELLYYLASNPNRVFTREQLLDQVWGFDYFGDLRTVDVHIKRLRTRIENLDGYSIKTVWGVGYKFSS